MTTVTYDQATRVYAGTDQPAVDRLDLEIADGELLVLVGPSGSGKSTALRMLAGLEPLDGGAIRIGERDVSDVRPRDRDIAMVFQNYALYPQLTVAENMGFALKQQGVPKEERTQRVHETARILDLQPYLDRKPKHLSGGQRQRVAMGRAIVRRPAVYLMDEPLSNLDAKLRVQTRAEVVELQDRLGVTTVYVTHDQVEAMTMGDRVAVLKDGVLQQCAPPSDLYHRPVNVFVAGFIGSPAMNMIAVDDERPVKIGGHLIRLDDQGQAALPGGDGPLTIGLRPEALRIGEGPLEGRIRVVEDLGSEVFVHVTIDHRGDTVNVISKMPTPFAGKPGENVQMQIVGTTYLFDATGACLSCGPAVLADGTSAPTPARS
jgi:multiple sugar transport system ATP-binding protein